MLYAPCAAPCQLLLYQKNISHTIKLLWEWDRNDFVESNHIHLLKFISDALVLTSGLLQFFHLKLWQHYLPIHHIYLNFLFFFLKTKISRVPDWSQLTTQPRMTLNPWSCLHFSSAGIPGVSHHGWLRYIFCIFKHSSFFSFCCFF